ncbi:MAG: hypothetical protein J0H14_26740 [Alphaproteobacteria bacterium]|nr:hypothetical protein [Alphaproteobacteria bacterium]
MTLIVLLTLGSGNPGHADDAGSEEPSNDRSPASEAPAVTLDKSQFNLFNPTPENALRPFSTDRPGKTHSSLTVDAGHFQLEGDLWNYTWDHWTKDDSTLRATTVVNPNLKLGVTTWAGAWRLPAPLQHTRCEDPQRRRSGSWLRLRRRIVGWKGELVRQ